MRLRNDLHTQPRRIRDSTGSLKSMSTISSMGMLKHLHQKEQKQKTKKLGSKLSFCLASETNVCVDQNFNKQ